VRANLLVEKEEPQQAKKKKTWMGMLWSSTQSKKQAKNYEQFMRYVAFEEGKILLLRYHVEGMNRQYG
jgi:hypothetical protein